MPDPSDSTASVTKAPEGSPSGQASEPAAGKPGHAPPAAEPLSLAPRPRSAVASVKDAATDAAGTPPASLTDLVQWMKMFAAATAAPPVEPTKPGARPQRATLSRDQRKFQRFDREATPSEAPAAPAAPAQPTAGNVPENRGADRRSVPPAAAPAPAGAEKPSTPSSPPVPMAPRGGTSVRRVRSVVVRQPRLWLALEAGALALLIGAFLLGRASVSKTAAPAGNTAPGAPKVDAGGVPGAALSPDAAKLIDEAMAAEQDRNFKQATDLLLQVKKDYPQVRGLDFRLASLALEQNDPAKAMPLLDQAITENDQPAAAYRLRGTIRNRQGINRGMNDFESATMVDPLSAENFYFWGEALRHAGKPQAALVKLQQAIDRLREPELGAEYRLKVRLTMVELGREQEFAPEMTARLAEDPPPPDWLLTAAAIALQHRDSASASNSLEKASRFMDKNQFTKRMRDYFFFSHRFEKPLAKFFAFAATTPPAAAAAPTSGAPDSPVPDTASPPPAASASNPARLPAGTP